MNEIIILSAKYLFVVSILTLIAYGLRQPNNSKKQLALITLFAGALALALAKISGHFIYDARPFVSSHIMPLIAHANDNGFPSDHTLLTSLIGFVVFIFSKKLGGALLTVALIVGLARVAAGIHHPLDIAGAFIISGIAVALTFVLQNHLSSRVTRLLRYF